MDTTNKTRVVFVPYQEHYLTLDHAIHSGVFAIVPTNLPYEGKVTIALTATALWVVTPHGQSEHIPLKTIEDMKVETFPGFVYQEVVHGVTTTIAPNDTTGVTISYRKMGRLIHRISFVTRVPRPAYDWIRRITEAVDTLYRRELLPVSDELPE